jgi:hypothetical protein
MRQVATLSPGALAAPHHPRRHLRRTQDAISGALRKRLGLTVESIHIREVGPNQTGAKANSTVYRITGSGTQTSNGYRDRVRGRP